MHSVPGLVKQAVSAGVVNPAAVLDGGLSVLDESRTPHPGLRGAGECC